MSENDSEMGSAPLRQRDSDPRPGVVHPVDDAFHRLAIAQRNGAWHEVEVLKAKLADAEEMCKALAASAAHHARESDLRGRFYDALANWISWDEVQAFEASDAFRALESESAGEGEAGAP